MNKKININPKLISLTACVLVLLFAAGYYLVMAWTEPTLPPPQANVPAPINVGSIAQDKAGALGAAYFRTPGHLTWRVNPAGHSFFGGNVGIGTTDTAGIRLDVFTSSVNEIGIRSRDDGGARIYTVAELGTGGWNPMSAAGDIGLIFHGPGGANTGGLMIGQWSAYPRGIRIAPDGNVGIGTPTPVARLHVDGNIIAHAPTADNHVATQGWVRASIASPWRECQILSSSANINCPAGWSAVLSTSGTGCGPFGNASWFFGWPLMQTRHISCGLHISCEAIYLNGSRVAEIICRHDWDAIPFPSTVAICCR